MNNVKTLTIDVPPRAVRAMQCHNTSIRDRQGAALCLSKPVHE